MQKINPCHIKDFAKNLLPKKLGSKKMSIDFYIIRKVSKLLW